MTHSVWQSWVLPQLGFERLGETVWGGGGGGGGEEEIKGREIGFLFLFFSFSALALLSLAPSQEGTIDKKNSPELSVYLRDRPRLQPPVQDRVELLRARRDRDQVRALLGNDRRRREAHRAELPGCVFVFLFFNSFSGS